MQQELLTNSTSTPAAYSGGVSKTAYTKPWTPSLWNDTDVTSATGQSFVIEWTRADRRIRLEFSTFLEPSGIPYLALQRLACHYAVEQIPDSGLNELSEAIAEMREFYAHQPSKLANLSLPEIATESATWGETFDRAPFSVTEG